MKLVLASHNAHKAREFARLLPGWDLEPYPGDLPEETGATFRDNAELKARHVHAATGGATWVLADDSGIQAAALAGRPGVRSARFAGEEASDEQNLAALLAELESREDRRVRYVAELVAIAPAGWELHARGELRGSLAATGRGEGGFGYDPAFVPDGETRTVGEMSAREKDAISHRARAAAALLAQLRSASVETDRLILRPLQPDDLPAFEPLWADEEVMRYIGAGGTRTGDSAAALLDALIAHREQHGFSLWAMVPREVGRPVGWAGLLVPTFLPAVLPAVEVDYGLGREWWGRGYATEAARAALDHGFGVLELDRLIAIVYPDNIRSLAVIDRLAMRPAGQHPHPATGETLLVFERGRSG
jgi:XTP/dITP diphosphohydrolase